MVGMAAYVAVRHTARHPHGSLVGFAFADELHDPHFVGVGDREGFAGRAIAVVAHKPRHHIHSLAGRAGALERDVNQRAVVDKAAAFQFGASAPCALGYGKAVLVHIADGGVGVCGFRNFASVCAAVPVVDGTHCARGMVGGRLMVKLAVERVAVGGIGYHRGTVVGSSLGCNKACARHGVEAQRKRGGKARAFEDVIVFTHKNCHKGTKVWSIMQIIQKSESGRRINHSLPKANIANNRQLRKKACAKAAILRYFS